MERRRAWMEARQYSQEELELARKIVEDVRAGLGVKQAVRRHPSKDGYIGKHVLVYIYRLLVD